MFREKEHRGTNGLLVLLVGIVMLVVSVIGIIGAANAEQGLVAVVWAVLLAATIIAFAGQSPSGSSACACTLLAVLSPSAQCDKSM